MANTLANVPVSKIIKNTSNFEDEPRKKSREDWRKAKELEEARKAGTAPAAVDEEGKDINPHIPQYISATPWYFGSQGPTLKHQRPQPEKQKQFSGIDEWYNRGVDASKAVTKYRKGACENCGAMTHKRKECMERPRKIGAKYTNADIAPDEFTQPELSMDYDGKRDRWAGYDPSEHRAIVEEYQKIEEAKRQMRAEKLNAEENDEQDSDKDEDKYVDEVDMPGTKVDSKQRITVRNLRIREDTAKYLRNLDPNSAYYDPKTRSMRDNPYTGTEREVDYKGENFARFSGDTQRHANAQLFAWEAHERGVDVHLLAEPTKLELLKQEYDKKRDELKDKARGSIINRYGGEEHLDALPPSLLLAQSEQYVEYSRYGKIIKGQDRQVIRSKYEEDVFPNNHTSVWGSFWQAGKWGYKCCHSFIKNSYCTGEAGIRASEAIVTETKKTIDDGQSFDIEKLDSYKEKSSSSDSSSDEEEVKSKTIKKSKSSKKKEKKRKQKEKRKNKEKKAKLQDQDELQQALQKEVETQKAAERLLQMDERKRPYNSMYEVKELSLEEIEAFQMKRQREDDPMAEFLNKGKSLQYGNSQLRFLSCISTMKKGLVLGVYETEDEKKISLTPTAAKYNELVKGKLQKNLLLAGPKIPLGQARVFWGLDEKDYVGVAVVGLGKKNLGINHQEEVHEGKESVRIAAAAGCRALDDVDIKDITLETLEDAEAAAEGAALSTWFFQGSRSKEKRKIFPKISLFNQEEEEEWRVGNIKAQAQNWARQLADTPANLMTPTIFSQEVSSVLTPLGISVQVHDKEWAEQKKMGSFLSVARGSSEPPKFVEMLYKGADDNSQPIVFVGKGVTFDAGGISLKPSSDMDEMRADMSGAACVSAVIRAAAELKLKVNIVGLIPLTENLPSSTATKPGDLVVAMNGKTIIVDNTDAEGRLILADALCYAQEFNPRFILDIATLTGAMRTSLGGAATGVFTNDTGLFEMLKCAGLLTGDRVWRLPLWQHFTDEMTKKTKSADVNNMAKTKGGGACMAAAFLREFVPNDTPWLHLDIAGVMGPGPDELLSYIPAGMTGRPTRTLIQFLQTLCY